MCVYSILGQHLINVHVLHLCETHARVFMQMMAVRRVLSIETASVAVRPPVHLRKSAWEPTYIVWMDATALMVFNYLLEFLLNYIS